MGGLQASPLRFPNAKMRSLPRYGWLYTVNGLLILFQLVFLVWTYLLLCQPRLALFPIDLLDVSVVATYVTIGIQFFTCFCGILGVIVANRNIVRIYWLLMVPLIAFDVVSAVVWAFRFHQLHREFAPFMGEFVQRYVHTHANLSAFCGEWRSIETHLFCCPPAAVRTACGGGGVWRACMPRPVVECAVPLMEWLHAQVDPLAAILYFLLTPLKLTVVFVLREDIMELFTEIVFVGNPNLYNRYWISCDSEDDDDETVTVSSSSQSQGPRSSSSHGCGSSERSLLHASGGAKMSGGGGGGSGGVSRSPMPDASRKSSTTAEEGRQSSSSRKKLPVV